MSFSLRNKKKLKSKKNISHVEKDIDPINPEIINYIKKLQNDKDKVVVIKQSKNQLPIQVEQVLTNKLINTNGQLNLNDNIIHEKDKRLAAKKGLLYF